MTSGVIRDSGELRARCGEAAIPASPSALTVADPFVVFVVEYGTAVEGEVLQGLARPRGQHG